MSFVWLVTLMIYGAVTGFEFHPLFWWALLPMVVQDLHDSPKEKSRQRD